MKANIIVTKIILLILLILAACSSTRSYYKSPYTEAEIMNIYNQRLKRIPVPYQSVYVGTIYGSTHIITAGDTDLPPLVLFHALGLNATMWLPNIEKLSIHFRLYMVDTVGELGKSNLFDFNKVPGNGEDYSRWFCAILDSLQIERTYITGASYGGWITLNCAIYAPQRVRGIALLGPMGVAPVSQEVVDRLIDLVFNPTDEKKQAMISWTLGENPVVIKEFADYMWVATNAESKIATPWEIEDKLLSKIQTPTLLFLGGKDGPIGDPQVATERAKKLIPNIEVVIFPNSGHLINCEEGEEVNKKIISFFMK